MIFPSPKDKDEEIAKLRLTSHLNAKLIRQVRGSQFTNLCRCYDECAHAQLRMFAARW
jgi:hypothetical protein